MRSVGYAFCCLLVQILSGFVSPLVIPGFSKIKEPVTAANWCNRSVSFIHASIMFFRALHFWQNMESASLNLDVNHVDSRSVSGYETLTVDIMIGYLLYDTVYEFSSNKGVPLMLAHHIVGVFSHVATRLYCSGPATYYT